MNLLNHPWLPLGLHWLPAAGPLLELACMVLVIGNKTQKNKAPSANTLTMVPAWLWFMALGATPERLVAWPKAAGASKQCEFMTVYVHENKTIVSFEYM